MGYSFLRFASKVRYAVPITLAGAILIPFAAVAEGKDESDAKRAVTELLPEDLAKDLAIQSKQTHPVEVSPEMQKALQKLHVGMTRKQVEQSFSLDGGLQSDTISRYFIKDLQVGGQVVMLCVVFRPSYMDQKTFADLEKRYAASQHPSLKHLKAIQKAAIYPFDPDDVVVGFGKPYLSGLSID